MITIDLTAPPPAPGPGPDPARGPLDALPRRLALSLPELEHLARTAGDAPLPFRRAGDDGPTTLEARLGRGPQDPDATAYAAALGTLRDPEESLVRRGLLVDGVADAGAVGALGLLATPQLAIDIDLVVGADRVQAWHRQSGDAVATLSTVDGIVFELTWCHADHWPAELARVAVLPEEWPLSESSLPEVIDLPFELLDATGVALRDGRSELVSVLARQHLEQLDEQGLDESDLVAAVMAFHRQARGRLRCLVARVEAERSTAVGVVSWLLLPDGWRALRAHRAEGEHRIEIRTVVPSDLPLLLAPVVTELGDEEAR